MIRKTFLGLSCVASILVLGTTANADKIRGNYLETRTCQVYTGPCFANAEVGLAGRDAILAWGIEEGSHQGVDLSGLSVVMVANGSDTLAFGGLDDPKTIQSVIYVDQKASQQQKKALLAFAKQHGGRAGQYVVRVTTAPIDMSLNHGTLDGKLSAGKDVLLATRKARPSDCICSNESAYYPPLAQVENFAPGVTLQGEFKGRGLGSRWSTPGDRSAYMATFAY